MSRLTPIFFAFLAGALAYFAVRGMHHSLPAPVAVANTPVITILAPVLAPTKLVPTGAKVSAKYLAPVLAPTLTPHLAPVSVPTPLEPTHTRIVINEIAWMGTESQANDEWMELYNPSSTSIALKGWKILIAGDNAISLTGSIGPGGYYLLERTDDTPVSDVAADYRGSLGQYGLSDSGEHLTLVDPSGAVVDDLNATGGWFAGVKDKGAKASMERISAQAPASDRTNWTTNNGTVMGGHTATDVPILGTPRAKNSVSG